MPFGKSVNLKLLNRPIVNGLRSLDTCCRRCEMKLRANKGKRKFNPRDLLYQGFASTARWADGLWKCFVLVLQTWPWILPRYCQQFSVLTATVWKVLDVLLTSRIKKQFRDEKLSQFCSFHSVCILQNAIWWSCRRFSRELLVEFWNMKEAIEDSTMRANNLASYQSVELFPSTSVSDNRINGMHEWTCESSSPYWVTRVI